MRSRSVIEQAEGKLMAASRCTADEASVVMVRSSQRQKIKLRDLASRIVTAQ